MQTISDNIRNAAAEASRSGNIETLFKVIDLAENLGFSQAVIATAVTQGYALAEPSASNTAYGLGIN